MNDILNALEDDDDFNHADIYLTPPDDGMCSDEDSGGEDDISPSNLSGNQLNAAATAVIHRKYAEKDVVGENESQTESDTETNQLADTTKVCDLFKIQYVMHVLLNMLTNCCY